MKKEINYNINKLKNIFKENRQKVFLVDSLVNREFKYGEIEELSLKAASVLILGGVKKGDKIAILGPNCAEFMIFYFACMQLGAVPVPLNVNLTPEEVIPIMDDADVSGLFYDQSWAPKLSKLLAARPKLKLFSFKSNNLSWSAGKGDSGDDKDFFSLVKRAKAVKKSFANINDQDTAIIIFTSGTTQKPKGVTITYGKIISNGSDFAKIMGLKSNLRFYAIMALSYLGGYYNLMLIPLLAQGSIVLENVFDAKIAMSFWEKIKKFKANALWLTPSMVSVILQLDRDKAGWAYANKNIKMALIGTAPLPIVLKKRFEQRYGITLYENYGLSETFFISTNSPKYTDNRGVGKILKNCRLEIKDAQGQPSPSGTPGEIVVFTPYLMEGYYNAPAADLARYHAEGFPTGDIGYVDVDGYLIVTDRKKDLIIKGGVNISPKEIEEVILSNPKVKEVAVVGITNELYGEKIVAFIAAKPGLKQQAIISLCHKNLAPYKIPQQIVFLKSLPKSSNGKIQKNKLREKYNQEAEPEALPKKELAKVIREISPAMSVKFNMMVYELKRKGKDVITLSLGEAFFKLPKISYDEIPFNPGCHYSSSWGIPEIRQTISQYYRRFGVKVNPETEVLVSAGSKVVIYMVLLSLIDPGDEVIILEPAWVSYEEQVRLCHGVPVMVPHYEKIENIKSYFSAKTKVIIINNPNNPSGRVYSRKELTTLVNFAKNRGIYIISDEAYSDFVNKEPFISLGKIDRDKSSTFIVNSFSKSLGVSGWRVGYVIADHKYLENVLKANQHLITCPTTMIEMCVAKYFDKIDKAVQPQILTLLKTRDRVAAYMDKIGLRYLLGTGTFYFMVSIEDSALDSYEFGEKLLSEYQVSTVPGVGYGKSVNKFLRISVGTESLERIKLGLDKVKQLIDLTKASS